ncbi:hypothetical protein [Parasitella parasitica]|uniref:Uncharacterized protein n=1 Tax=Parasitella parasitica TaxID=35722 RepID=A0A0B7NBY3_9FUNG|nr:hypothetical protein [Parasitella parasitica]
MSVLSAFTEQKKIRPVYQFKRGNTFSSSKPNGIPSYQQRQQEPPSSNLVSLLQSSISSSSSSCSTTIEDKKADSPPKSIASNKATLNADDAIFDFPDSFDEFEEIKVMVASTRAMPEAPKLARKRSKPKKNSTKTAIQTSSKGKAPVNNNKKRPLSSKPTTRHIAPAPSIHKDQQEAFDIFAFDPLPTSHLTSIDNNIPPTRPHYSTNLTNSINPVPFYHKNHTTYHSIPIASLLNEASPVETPSPVPVEKKRKRNLVAHLKTASGEKENRPIKQEFDCLSDEDDLALEQQQKSPLMPLKDLIKDRSLSPELSYEETMQIQLNSLMKSEFGESSNLQQPQTETKKRPQYKPLNKLNVRVTFQKK